LVRILAVLLNFAHIACFKLCFQRLQFSNIFFITICQHLFGAQSDASALHMWRYVAREYGTTYDWYYFAPDSTYVRADRLVEFLDHVGVVKHLMVGRPVVLDSDNTRVSSCDFNAGVLLSQVSVSFFSPLSFLGCDQLV